MNISLEGKKAIVCGGSKGIGFAVARELASLGATCILLARGEVELKTALTNLTTSFGQTHSYHVIDMAHHDAVTELVQKITAKQTIHILINNSGGPSAGPILNATTDQFINAFQQHLITNHILVRGVIGGMKEEHWGRIINIISTSVKIPLKNLGVSNTIRGAVASWAKTMANELGPLGITVNNILPGMTKTGRLDELIKVTANTSGVSISDVEKKMQEEIPAARFGDPKEIAAVAAFLATPAAAYVNGASIPVDGGRTGSI